MTLIDPDRVEEHNLDRLLYGTVADVGRLKVDVAARAIRAHATAESIDVVALPASLQEHDAYHAALDCDILFSCVDRPVPRDVLNYMSQAHLIPVIDGGVAVQVDRRSDRFFSAHWRAHLATPYHQCLRCSRQYDSSMVVMELDGSLDDPSYIADLPLDERDRNQNVFPFSQSVAAMEMNLLLRYLLARDWWPAVNSQDHQFITGETTASATHCHPGCSFREKRAQGDAQRPFYVADPPAGDPRRQRNSILQYLLRIRDKLFRKA